MSVFDQVERVRMARLRVSVARYRLATPANALLQRGRNHPLTTMGAAAGAGFALGSLNVRPSRVPGLGPLLGGGLAEAVAYGTRLIVELGLMRSERGAAKPADPDSTDGDVA